MAAASGEEVKLLGAWASPFVIRVKIALELKGVSYEYLEQQLGDNNKSELLIKSNPVYKKVPVLIHKDRPICESAIIIQYIDQVWAGARPSILPSDPYERAIARFWAGYIDDTCFPALLKIIKVKEENEKAEGIEQTFVGLGLLEEAYEKSFKGKPFFGGDNVGYLDIAFESFVCWVKMIEKITGIKFLDEAKFPLLAKWAERFGSVTTLKDHIPETDKMVELYWKVIKPIWDSTSAPNN